MLHHPDQETYSMTLKIPVFLAFLTWSITAYATRYPLTYDEHADPKSEFVTALAEARSSDKKVLIIFGANWCPDCQKFDKQLQSASINAVIDNKFVIIKANIGNWDKNMDFAEWFGNPAKEGIPSIAIVDADRNLYSTTHGNELAMLRYYSTTKLTDWFILLANDLHEKKILDYK